MTKVSKYLVTLLTFILCHSVNVAAQSGKNSEDKIAENILKGLEATEPIKNLYVNRATIHDQLRDVNNWASHTTKEDFTNIQLSYEETRKFLADFTQHFCDDLRTIRSVKDLNNKKIEQLGNRALTTYREDLRKANSIYTTKFVPLYNRLAENNGSSPKKGFPLLPLIIEAIPIVVNLINDLIKNNGNEATDAVLQLAIVGVTKGLESKLNLPSWNSFVINRPGVEIIPAQSQVILSTNDNLKQPDTETGYNSVDANIFFQDKDGSNIELIAKNVNFEGNSIKYYETAEKLSEGFIFQVNMTGYSFVNIFGYDQESSMWQWLHPKLDLSKAITTVDLNGGSIKLPYFKITGNNPDEHFLMVLSNRALDSKRLNSILYSNGSTAIIGAVFNAFGNMTKSPNFEIGAPTKTIVAYTPTDGNQVILPVYIKLNRN